MEIGETGEHGQAAVGAVVLVPKLVLDNAITLLRKTVEEIAVAAIKKGRPATHTLVVITMANCCFTIYSLSSKRYISKFLFLIMYCLFFNHRTNNSQL